MFTQVLIVSLPIVFVIVIILSREEDWGTRIGSSLLLSAIISFVIACIALVFVHFGSSTIIIVDDKDAPKYYHKENVQSVYIDGRGVKHELENSKVYIDNRRNVKLQLKDYMYTAYHTDYTPYTNGDVVEDIPENSFREISKEPDAYWEAPETYTGRHKAETVTVLEVYNNIE